MSRNFEHPHHRRMRENRRRWRREGWVDCLSLFTPDSEPYRKIQIMMEARVRAMINLKAVISHGP